jgi:hypothetical protein
LSSSDEFEAAHGSLADIFSFLGAEAVEDVLFIYLQTRGWLVVPHSRKADTMGFEFILIHEKSKKRGIAQVKTGWTPLNREEWKDLTDEVFLFQTNGAYTGADTPGITCLEPNELRTFIVENLDIMPRAVQRWVVHLNGHA